MKKDDQEKLKLSEHELKFHQSYHSYFPNVNGAKYYNAVTKHFNESFLQFVPDKLKVEEDIMGTTIYFTLFLIRSSAPAQLGLFCVLQSEQADRRIRSQSRVR